jgi:thymidylate synthase
MFHEDDVPDFLLMHSLRTKNWADYTYLKLVEDVLANGVLKPTRAKIDGQNISAYSVFGRQARFSLAEGFPILTTKKINFNAIAHELIWFLSGSSNIKYLRDNGVKIWDAWADEKGELGYGTYGTLWRKYPNYKEYITSNGFNQGLKTLEKKPIDQIKNLIDNINLVKENPTASVGRRLIVTAWHPGYVDSVGLPPCHCFMQFNVTGDKLSCQLYQRSCDAFLGVPFNISSYALLTHVIAYITGLQAHEFIHTYGDLHIYENHVDQLREQLNRRPYKLPKLEIWISEKNIDKVCREDFKLVDYKHHPYLRGEVAV